MTQSIKLSRRRFLKNLSLLGSAALTYGVLPKSVYAAQSGNGTKVLFLNLNGGLDGLYTLQPSSGQLYSTLASMRSTLTLNPGSLLQAKYGYGFHPNLPLFKSLFDTGELGSVLSVGYNNMSRSHLESEVAMSRGVADRLAVSQSGFLNRLGAYYKWDGLHAMSVSGTDLVFEGGDYRGLQVRSLADFYFKSFGDWHDGDTYSEIKHIVDAAASQAQDAPTFDTRPEFAEFSNNLLSAENYTDVVQQAVDEHSPAVSYPNTYLGKGLKDIDILFSSPTLDTQVGYLKRGGLDTHSNQKDNLEPILSELNAALTSFVTSMKSKGLWEEMIIMIYSEFGRTNRENGSGGTDHGGANPVFLLGGAVNGGDILGDISVSDLSNNGWLPMKYNIVEVYRRVVERMGLDPDAAFGPSGGPSLAGLFG